MPSPELTKNLPHIIAAGVLIFALLIIATKTGLVGCSSLGSSYCDIYYSVVGKPTVLIISGDDGMGSPDTLARLIEANHRLPVQKLRVDQVSRGNIQDYSLIIVERAREIPTEKLKIFYDYLFEDMGRLVWVGDAGTIGSSGDETCKLMQFSAEWTADDGKHREDYEENICVKESSLSVPGEASASQVISVKRDALVNKAFAHLQSLCADAFGGEFGVYTTKGYPCQGGTAFKDVYFNWKNEASFRAAVNPWARGEYEKITTEGTQPGIDFAQQVLGVGFVADDYAVAEFDEYFSSIGTVRNELAKAHAGFVACAKALANASCDPQTKLAIVRQDRSTLNGYYDSADTELAGIVTALNSLAQQKEAKNESSSAVENAATHINTILDDMENTVALTDETSLYQIELWEGFVTKLGTVKEELTQLRGGESDATVRLNYDSQISKVEARIASFNTKIPQLEQHIQDYNSCAGTEVAGVAEALGAETGYPAEMAVLIAYSSPLIDENGAMDFIRQANTTSWKALASELNTTTIDCGGADFATGMEAAAAAITAAQTASATPGAGSGALATMTVADTKHPLVAGITQAKDLKKSGLPVPFVLVEGNDVNSHDVVQLRVTPAYKGVTTWPGITVKDPKFASHMFGRGVVVYYAFPPETDEVFVKNLVDFMLY